MKLPNKVYDVLKYIAMIFFPACAVLMQALGNIYGWAWAETVVQTIVAVNAFLGALIGISCANYYKEEPEITFLAYENFDENGDPVE